MLNATINKKGQKVTNEFLSGTLLASSKVNKAIELFFSIEPYIWLNLFLWLSPSQVTRSGFLGLNCGGEKKRKPPSQESSHFRLYFNAQSQEGAPLYNVFY